jgi:hypothetical protein
VIRHPSAVALGVFLFWFSSGCSRHDEEDAKRKLHETQRELKHETQEASQKLKQGAHEAAQEVRRDAAAASREMKKDTQKLKHDADSK